ncbi:Transthyretin-like family protein [Cooperia oncophora]
MELTPIDPIFKVYHDCDDGIKPGSRKVKFALPKSYITNGMTPKKTFRHGTSPSQLNLIEKCLGILNLETIFAKEEREMIVTRRRRGRVYDEDDRSSSDESI